MGVDIVDALDDEVVMGVVRLTAPEWVLGARILNFVWPSFNHNGIIREWLTKQGVTNPTSHEVRLFKRAVYRLRNP